MGGGAGKALQAVLTSDFPLKLIGRGGREKRNLTELFSPASKYLCASYLHFFQNWNWMHHPSSTNWAFSQLQLDSQTEQRGLLLHFQEMPLKLPPTLEIPPVPKGRCEMHSKRPKSPRSDACTEDVDR